MGLSRAAQLLREFVAIPSVNPMGRSDMDPAIAGERRYAEAVHARLQRLGVDAQVIGQGERKSVVGVVEAASPTDRVLIASHLDTVPIDGMSIAPFHPVIDGDRLYGRGSCDTKAGMAALLAALEQVLSRGKLRRSVILVGEADEEMGSAGVNDVLVHLGATRVDWALATEPTGMRLVSHHKGRTALRLVARGRACHSSNPDAGDNAISLAARAALALEGLQRTLAANARGVLGSGTVAVTMISGGHAPNIVPDQAVLVVDRRTLPQETEAHVEAEINGALERAGLAGRVVIEAAHPEKNALGTAADQPAVVHSAHALRAGGLEGEPISVPFATDAGPLAAHGIPSVVLGPGAIDKAHTADEFVPLSEVEAMQAFFERLLSG